MKLVKKIIVAALPSVVAAGLGCWLWFRQPDEGVPPSDVSTSPGAAVAGNLEVEGVDTAAVSSPSGGESAIQRASGEPEKGVVSESDVGEDVASKPPLSSAEIRLLLSERGAELSVHELWRQFIEYPEALVVFVKAVEQVSGGNRPLVLGELAFLPVPAPFEAVEKDGVYVLAPATEARFTPIVEALSSIDAGKAVEVLDVLEPELDRIVVKVLGYPSGTRFRALFMDALTMVLTTPVPEKSLELVRVAPHLFKYALPELEQLPDVQKFILRTGLSNQARLNEAARRFWSWASSGVSSEN